MFCSQKSTPVLYLTCGDFNATVSYHGITGDFVRFRCTVAKCKGSHVIQVCFDERIIFLIFFKITDRSIFKIEKIEGKKKKLTWEEKPSMYSRVSYSHVQCTNPHTCAGRDLEYLNRAQVQSFIRQQISGFPSL